MCPASVDRLPVSPSASVQPPSRAQTVTNNLALVTGGPSTVKDTNVRGAGSMEGVETVRVTDMTSGSAFTKSIGSLFSTINKSVSSAFSSLMAAPGPAGGDAPRTTATTPTQPDVVPSTVTAAAPDPAQQHGELDFVSAGQPRQHLLAHGERPQQQADAPEWRRVQAQSYAEPSAYRGRPQRFANGIEVGAV